VAAVLEVGMADGSPESLEIDEGVTLTDNVIAHVMDVGANYWSLWNWHAERAENVMRYYHQYPEMIDTIGRRVGYRVRPSLVWHYGGNDHGGLVIGFANDGIAGVPGVLRVGLRSDDGRMSPEPRPRLSAASQIRQALPLPRGPDWRTQLRAGSR
jgi:hypothetical protein